LGGREGYPGDELADEKLKTGVRFSRERVGKGWDSSQGNGREGKEGGKWNLQKKGEKADASISKRGGGGGDGVKGGRREICWIRRKILKRGCKPRLKKKGEKEKEKEARLNTTARGFN